jgi:beta-glucosidase
MTVTDANGSAGVARRFPAGFLWGAATAAYQIEGAANEDGRGPSVWDTFSHTPGKVRGGDTGDVACDFYHHSDEDLDLLSELGLGAFRFSISWPRVQPDGRGTINQKGLDFYRRLVDGLTARQIVPAVTLYHWDLPQALEDDGGWANRDTSERFAELAQVMAEAIGDGCPMWITLNEPQVVANQGYRIGVHAPGHTDDALAAATTHHLLLGHGLALERLRSVLPGAQVGITLNLHPIRSFDAPSEEAATVFEAEQNRIFMDPVLHGSYPAAARAHMLPPDSLVHDGDMQLIGAAIDFLGINYYSPHYLKQADPTGSHADETPVVGRDDVVSFKPLGVTRSAMGWIVEPDGLYDTLMAVTPELPAGCRIYITENGCAAEDYIDPNGNVNDVERVEYLRGHLAAAWRAIQDGVPLDGYFHWSLLDNFEWAWGYQKRFGLVFIDYGSQRRIPKQSAAVYREVAVTNELVLESEPIGDVIEAGTT